MKRIPFLHILLFAMTFLSTLAAGALQGGANPLEDPRTLLAGFPFAVTLMAILLSHELGHYFASRYHNTDATLPYFIPAPSIIGTFGAFIKMRSPIITRRALVDIGASGPIVGFILSVVASVVGLAMSDVMLVPEDAGGMLVLGDSIIFKGLSYMILGPAPDGFDVFLHPVAFAGWIGLFVTTLNLLPVGQLDGGHIAYALFGQIQRRISISFVAVLAVCGLFFWPGWGVWAILMLVLGLRHPPVMYWETPLARSRVRVGIAALAIFVLTFTPVPFSIS